MWLTDLLFGTRRRRAPRVIASAPQGVRWRQVKPMENTPPVRAWAAQSEHELRNGHGVLHAQPGDMIVEHAQGARAVVRRDIFNRTYEPLGGGLYRKRDDVVMRYFTMNEPVTIRTLEGLQDAERGDWIMQGVDGELWPVPHEQAVEKYRPI